MNFKINFEKNEYFISPRRKFASILELLEAYKNTPIRSKKMSSERILLLHPIPVDKSLEQQHKKLLEDKGQTHTVYFRHNSIPILPDELKFCALNMMTVHITSGWLKS